MLFHDLTRILAKENNTYLVLEALTYRLPAAENQACEMMMKLLRVGREHSNFLRDTVIINVMHYRGN